MLALYQVDYVVVGFLIVLTILVVIFLKCLQVKSSMFCSIRITLDRIRSYSSTLLGSVMSASVVMRLIQISCFFEKNCCFFGKVNIYYKFYFQKALLYLVDPQAYSTTIIKCYLISDVDVPNQ